MKDECHNARILILSQQGKVQKVVYGIQCTSQETGNVSLKMTVQKILLLLTLHFWQWPGRLTPFRTQMGYVEVTSYQVVLQRV